MQFNNKNETIYQFNYEPNRINESKKLKKGKETYFNIYIVVLIVEIGNQTDGVALALVIQAVHHPGTFEHRPQTIRIRLQEFLVQFLGVLALAEHPRLLRDHFFHAGVPLALLALDGLVEAHQAAVEFGVFGVHLVRPLQGLQHQEDLL